MTRERLGRTLRELDADWAALLPSTCPVPITWVADCQELAAVATLDDIFFAIWKYPDAIMLALLRRQRAGDTLAGRTVLQAMLPKAVRLAIRDPEASLSDVIALMWERISTYPLERRPQRIAANLALDTLKSVVAARARSTHMLISGAGDEENDPCASEVIEAGARLGLIDPRTQRTLEYVYLGGRSSRAAAVELGVSSDLVRWRCSRGVRALRQHRQELLAELAA
ncbi:MAG: RNA polymerase sigma factor [Propioniciclava sp.]